MLKKKACILGAFAVGKTSLVQRYVHSIFSEKYHTTVGVKIDKKTVIVDESPVDLILWDLHGEDDFQSLRMSYLRGASGCIYVIDGTRRKTLDTALNLSLKVKEAWEICRIFLLSTNGTCIRNGKWHRKILMFWPTKGPALLLPAPNQDIGSTRHFEYWLQK